MAKSAPRYETRRITVGVVDRLEPGHMVMDSEQPGFGVRNQGGARIYFLRKFARGRRHFVTFGEHGTGGLTVTSAREKASRLVNALRDGLAPAERRARERTMPTVGEYAEQWLTAHVDAKLKKSTARQYRSTIKALITPAIGRVRVDQLADDHIAELHLAAQGRPYAANRALAVLSKMMNAAERDRLRPHGTNPVKGIERFRESRRERFLSRDEMAGLGRALSDPAIGRRHSPFALAAIALLLLTGMRRNEVLALRWREVDFERGMLLLEDSKTGRKPVLLGAPALQLLANLPRVEGASKPFVFPGAIDGKPLQDIKKAWQTVRAASGLDGVRIHDLRHTFASVTAGAGGSLPMIGRLLGHTQSQTTNRYAHLASDPLRELADRAAASISTALGFLPLALPSSDRKDE